MKYSRDKHQIIERFLLYYLLTLVISFFLNQYSIELFTHINNLAFLDPIFHLLYDLNESSKYDVHKEPPSQKAYQ